MSNVVTRTIGFARRLDMRGGGLLAPTSSYATPAYYIDVIANASANSGPPPEPFQSNEYDSRVDTPTGLTANSVSATATKSNGSVTFTGNSTAAANLAQGAVRASGSGNYAEELGSGAGSGYAQLFDTLNFNIAGATSTTQTHIGITLHLDGATNSGPQATANDIFVLDIRGLGIPVSNYSFFHQVQYAMTPAQSISDTSGAQLAAWISPIISNSGINGVDFSAEFTVIGPTPEITINEWLDVSAASGASLDFSSTGSLNLILPTDVSFTSASGVFLSTPLNEIPEPMSVAIFAIGLAGFAFGRAKQGI